MPCSNGQAYSVSQNKVVFLPSCQDSSSSPSSSVSSVKLRVTELEQATLARNGGVPSLVPDRKGLVLNLTSQFEAAGSKPGSPDESSTDPPHLIDDDELVAMTQTKLAPQKLQAILVKKEIWDPAEHKSSLLSTSPNNKCVSEPQWISPRSNSPIATDLPPVTSDMLRTQDPKPSSPTPPRINDPFSAQLDRVFDREERRQQRLSTSMPVEVTNVACQDKLLAAVLSSSMETALPAALRECPSRQSSWSSYDSAVVLGYQGEPREAPSRQSSWGSADTRWTYGTLPSRNSSWGSYDIRPNSIGSGNNVTDEKLQQQQQQQIPDDLESLFSNSSSGMFSYDREAIPWYPGTVKRTKQKLEAEVTTIKRVCSESGVPISQASSSSPPNNTSDTLCETFSNNSPPVISTSTATLKLQGPRPYQNPSNNVVSPVPVVPNNKTHLEENGFDTSQSLVHYASSPTLCQKRVDDEMVNAGVTEKMAISQPNISSYPVPSCIEIRQNCRNNQADLDVSPHIINSSQCPSVKKSLEELVRQPEDAFSGTLQATPSVVAPAVNQEPEQPGGVVKNLKKEFEAKYVRKERAVSAIEPIIIKDDETNNIEINYKSDKVKSLPSSPVSNTATVPQSISTSGTPVEDLTVKMLVDKFEVSRNNGTTEIPNFCRSISDSPPNTRTRFLSENNSSSTKRRSSPAGLQPPVPPRKSSFEVTASSGVSNVLARNLRNGNENRSNRLPPPAQPSNMLGIVKPKKQQGKTHPLNRLTINNKPRHNNPVYNTM